MSSKVAVALSYNPKERNAPQVVASGSGRLADQIVEEGKKANLTIYQDPNLAQFLFRIRVGDEIPPEVYRAVSVIFRFLIKAQKEKNN